MMRKFLKLQSFIFALLLLGAGTIISNAQTDEPNYAFVIFETAVSQKGVETDDNHPEERRFYVSNIVDFPSSDPALFRRASKIADDFFTASVVEPLKAKGILHHYYDDAIHINDSVVYRLDTKADVEEVRVKALKELSEQNVNVFTFTWVRAGTPGGLDMSKPVLLQHNPGQPLYGVTDGKTPAKETVPAPKRKPGTDR